MTLMRRSGKAGEAGRSRRGRLLPFTLKVKELVRSIPAGRAASYGQIAALAGEARAARQVAWILHSSPARDRLPWHRVLGAGGRISLPALRGGAEQRKRLAAEGVPVGKGGTVDLGRYGWSPRRPWPASFERLDLDRLAGDPAGNRRSRPLDRSRPGR